MFAAIMAFTLAQGMGGETPTGEFLVKGQTINQITVNRIDYIGDCPGQGVDRIGGVSFRAELDPAPSQRILITNQTTGGYTDREYDERRTSSEPFVVASGQGQHGSFLSLAPGWNTFTYTVRQAKPQQQIGSGVATLWVQEERRTRYRSFSTINVDQYCLLSRSRDLSSCSNGLTTVERTGVCPDGQRRILSQETVRVKP
jgi:hypothetical protein